MLSGNYSSRRAVTDPSNLRGVANLWRRLAHWPALRQWRAGDALGLGTIAASLTTEATRSRTATADRVVRSVCPYCAVGCGQLVYVHADRIIDIEGDPDSPISRGRLCPKGAATYQLVTGAHRQHSVLYRRPYSSDWQPMPLEQATQMVAERVKATRDAHWDRARRRTMAIASLGGATLDNEENYLIKKLFTALGAIQIENQARI